MTLAIFTPHVGVDTETFVQKHVQRLLPGRTVVIAWNTALSYKKPWKPGCPTLFLETIKTSQWKKEIEKFLRQHRVTHILGEHLDFSLKAWLPARKLGIRFFAHAHGGDVSARMKDRKTRKAYLNYNSYGCIIAVSRYQRRKLSELGIRPGKIHVIPCGPEVPARAPEHRPRRITRLIAVGRMVPVKSPLLILESFCLALKKNPDLHLDYVGSGELWHQVPAYVARHGLEKKVKLWGTLPNSRVRSLMKKSDIFIHHSVVGPDGSEEGLPVVILEAMAEAIPVVATRHAGIPEAVLHGKTGLLSEERDCSEMAKNILKLAGDHRLRMRMGLRGWKRAGRFFSWKRERSRLLKRMGLSQS